MKKILLTTMMMVLAISVLAQTQASAYIVDDSGSPTNVRNAPGGAVVLTLPAIDGGYVVTLLEVKNNWWRIDPIVDIYGDEDDEYTRLEGSKTGYWVHYSVLGLDIAGERENVIREKPSMQARPLKFEASYLYETGLRPLEVKGDWIKVVTTDKRYTGWMPVDRICYNPLTTCP